MTTAIKYEHHHCTAQGLDLRISAPPIADVVVYPLMKLNAVLAASAPAAIMGLPGAIVIKAPMVAALVASNPELMA